MSQAVELIPIDAIDEGALIRDRIHLDEEALGELKASIAASGLRMPVEVFALGEAREGRTHGLISGLRRLTAVRALHAETGEARYAAIPAFVRAPEDMAAALAAVVEENEVRADVSPWERGRIAVLAWRQELFATIEEAVDRLHPAADRMKRARLRAFARVADELQHHFAAPERLSQAQMLRLADAIRAGFAEDLRVALTEVAHPRAEADWPAVLPVIEAAERAARTGEDGGRRVLHLPNGWTVRRERIAGGFRLRFSGEGATAALLAPLLDALEAMLAEPRALRAGGAR